MKKDYGMSGCVAEWLKSYLSNRHESILINGNLSDKTLLDFCLPQGSAFGPFGFKLYTKPLTAIAHKHNIQLHLYADDTHLYIHFNPEQSEEAMGRLEECIEDIRDSMNTNFLKLNDIVHNFRHPEECEQGNRMDCKCWRCHYREFTVSEKHRSKINIRATFDSTSKMETHIVNMKIAC